MKIKRYYGWNFDEDRVMFACVTGQMNDGTFVYTECQPDLELIDPDKQYVRRLKYGTQIFFRV